MPADLVPKSSQPDVEIDVSFTRVAPLPRLSPLLSSNPEKYEVLVVGAGPSGLMLTTLLTRFGLTSASVLNIDSRPHQTLTGNADGVNGRTLEILGQLGLESTILRDGNHFAENTLWVRDPNNSEVLFKAMQNPFFLSPARYEQLVTLHQGRIEKIFRDDVKKHGGSEVQYSSKLVAMTIDEDGDADFPVLATIEINGMQSVVRTKYLVGADGASSAVRDFMGVDTEGDQRDELWGVMDLVVDSNFPDLRRMSNISASTPEAGIWGSASGGFIIPRERLSNGEFLTRLYLDMSVKGSDPTEQKQTTKERKSQITQELILKQAARLFHPFRFEIKEGSQVEWWSAFQISQRLAKTFTLNDSSSKARVFIVGDACHSHSPRQGQGMNVSMQDSHNLAWKLAYTVLGLDSSEGNLLKSYEEERLPNARDLIAFDGRMNQEERTPMEKIADMRHFSIGAGIQYQVGTCVSRKEFDHRLAVENKVWTSDDHLNGVIIPGRRLLNSKIKRFSDSNWRDIHDELGGDGRFTILMFGDQDFGRGDAISTKAAAEVCNVIKSTNSKFAARLLRSIILFPRSPLAFEWKDLPNCVKEEAEMSLFCATQETYDLYGIDEKRGVLVVVRPDGVVGMVSDLDDVESVVGYLRKLIRMD